MTQSSCCRFIKPSNWQLEPRPWCWTQHVQPEVLDLISQRYDLRHVVDLLEVDVDLELFDRVMLDLAQTQYAPQDRTVILLHDTDYAAPGQRPGNTVYNFFRLCAHHSVPLEKIIMLTNHWGITADARHLAEVICNNEPPVIIETALWYDFPEESQLSCDTPGTWSGQTLFVCPNNKLRRHRIFALCCMADQHLLDRGAVSFHF